MTFNIKIYGQDLILEVRSDGYICNFLSFFFFGFVPPSIPSIKKIKAF